MRIANTEVAGLTGGLYEWFEKLGLSFFSWLIGRVRAERLELEYRRVTAGAILVGVILGTAVGLLIVVMAALANESLGCAAIGVPALSACIGGLLLLILAVVMIHYIRMLREKDVRSASASLAGASFNSILAERNQKNLDSGYPPRDAYREAWWFAALSTGMTRRIRQ